MLIIIDTLKILFKYYSKYSFLSGACETRKIDKLDKGNARANFQIHATYVLIIIQ